MAVINIKGRLSFEHVFKADAGQNGGDPKFSASILLPKNDPQLSLITKEIAAAAKAKWNEKAEKILAALRAENKICLHDGDLKDYEGYEGMFYLSASNSKRPLVIDRSRNPVTEADGLVYSGCYVIARIDIWAQDNSYGKRINANLLGVQFFEHGDAFTGGARPATTDDFEDLGDQGQITEDPLTGFY